MVEVLFSDNHLLALNKPSGLLTQPSGTLKESLEQQAKAWIKESAQKPGNVYLHAVHRLDTPVSGIVLFAKTSKALSRLQEQLRRHQFRKVYFALVHPTPRCHKETLVHWLAHREHYAEVVTEQDLEGKQAELEYEALEKVGESDLVKVTLKTGRYHQIRAQMAAIGSPIVGDGRYGSTERFGEGAIALHHGELEFVHPVTGQGVLIKCAPDFNRRLSCQG